jgi:hypothetical protein
VRARRLGCLEPRSSSWTCSTAGVDDAGNAACRIAEPGSAGALPDGTGERDHAVVALLAAERARHERTRDAEIEYSETVAKLREHFELDLAEAATIRRSRVTPAHRAYNGAVVAAERGRM